MKKLTESKVFNVLAYMSGSIFYGFTSLVFLIIITRLININAAGQFSFAFAVSSTFYIIGVYFGTAFQVTDTSNKYSDTDYLFNRLTTILIMIVLTLLFSLLNKYNINKLLLIMLLVIYRSFDALLESFHSIVQKKDKIYKVGFLMFFRTLFLMLCFFIVSFIFKNIVLSILSLIFVDLIFTITFEYSSINKIMSKTKYSSYKNILLLLQGLSVCIFSFFAMYILNSPKYAIDKYLGDDIQGIFGIIFMPSSFISLISLYLVHPFLNDFSVLIKNKDLKKLNRLLFKLLSIIIIFGIFVVIVTNFLGIPVLELLYGVDLKAYNLDLILIMIGAIVYSIYSLLSSIIIALRKNIYQVLTLFFVSVVAFIVCNSLTQRIGIRGAVYSYLIIMLFQLILYFIVYFVLINKFNKRKKITVRLMGGLGNQMFQYAFLRNISLNNDADAIIDLRGITNKTHNKYGLNHCNISDDIKIIKKDNSVKQFVTYLMYGFYCVFFISKKYGFKFYKFLLTLTRNIGVICIPDGYVDFDELTDYENYAVGYFQSPNYCKENKDIIRKELQISDKLTDKNKKVYNEIIKSESVCVHIRRGDYIGSNFDVCSTDYYYRGIKEIKKHKKSITIYIFSDDIDWVKSNMTFKDKVVYVDWKNNQYEDMKLMSGCKNFVMSNSSFSYWAQFLSLSKNKIVVAPSKWFRNNQKTDIYDESWILIDV